jgi:MOSC domain-containing protein YiiM
MPRLISIQVGMPQTYSDPTYRDSERRVWSSAIFKSAVHGPRRAGPHGLDGDGQQDTRVHGGPDKAILAYSADHYPRWKEILQRPEIDAGGFGENLTIAGLTEQTVCLGDEWDIGNVRLQVSQPRQPCWKLGRRWQIPELPKYVIQRGWSGWYCRVLTGGEIEAGQELQLVHRPWPEWTIHRLSTALYDRTFPLEDLQKLLTIPELSAAWRKDLSRRLESRKANDPS